MGPIPYGGGGGGVAGPGAYIRNNNNMCRHLQMTNNMIPSGND